MISFIIEILVIFGILLRTYNWFKHDISLWYTTTDFLMHAI